jgi:hypothetical protein
MEYRKIIFPARNRTPAFQILASRFFFIRLVGGGVQLGPLGTSATVWPVVHAPGFYDDGEFGEMKIGRGNRSTRRKPAPAPLCPPQIPLDQTRVRTPAALSPVNEPSVSIG